MTLDEALSRPTIPVPDAGSIFFGLSRNGSYEAAKRGDIPTVSMGRKRLALVAPIAERLGLHHNLRDANRLPATKVPAVAELDA